MMAWGNALAIRSGFASLLMKSWLASKLQPPPYDDLQFPLHVVC